LSGRRLAVARRRLAVLALLLGGLLGGLLRGELRLLLRLLHLRRAGHELRPSEALLLGRALRGLSLRREAGLAGVRGSSGRIAGRLIHRAPSL